MKNAKVHLSNKLKWIIAVVIVLLIIAAATMFSNPGIPIITAKVEKGDIRSYISQQAKTDLSQIYKITMPYNSRILPVTLTPGTPVKEGQVVASLNLSEINTQVSVAKAELESVNAQIQLNEYRNFIQTALIESKKWINTMEQILGITKIKITASQHVLDYAIQHKNALVQSGRAVSRIEQNEAEMQAAVKEVNLQSSRLAYNAMDIFTTICKLAPVYINEYINMLNIEKEILASEKSKAEAELYLANTHFGLAEMKSPVNGIILKRYVTNERFLPIGTEILDIGVMSDLEISADILTTEVTNIRVDDPVDIFGATTGNSFIQGKVSKIEPQGFTDISSLGVKQQKVKVKVSINKGELDKLEESGYKMGVGYRVYVKIYTSEAKNAVIAPRTALFKGSNNTWNVFTVVDNKAELKKVKVGIMNDDSAQILSGVEINDLVIVAPPTSLGNGTKVKIL